MTLTEQKKLMVEYLKLKLEQEDWHGVADAAMDLRELEVRLKNQEGWVELVEAVKAVQDTLPFSGTPGKLQWPEWHYLRQSLEALEEK